jgi:hypothetical protein
MEDNKNNIIDNKELSINDKIKNFYNTLTKEALEYKDAMMRCCCDC